MPPRRPSDLRTTYVKSLFAELKKGRTQKDLADLLHVDQSRISVALKDGKIGTVTLLAAARLAGHPIDEVETIISTVSINATTEPLVAVQGRDIHGEAMKYALEHGMDLSLPKLAAVAVSVWNMERFATPRFLASLMFKLDNVRLDMRSTSELMSLQDRLSKIEQEQVDTSDEGGTGSDKE